MILLAYSISKTYLNQLFSPMKICRTLQLIVFLLTIIISANAQDNAPETVKKAPPVRFLIAGALELGGDEVAKIYFTNGETQSVKAGQGGSIGAGLQVALTKSEKLFLRGTLGIKYVTTQADNAHIRLTRMPINLTAHVMASDKIRLSAGLSMHQAIRFKSEGIGPDFKLNNASGPIFEIAYKVIGLSYTAMTYKDQNNVSYSANAIGITISGAFPKK
jgi:hypothetical protein